MKWAAVGVSEIEKSRFEKLSKAIGTPNELTFLDWKPEDDFLKQFGEYVHVRFGESVQPECAKRLQVHSSWTSLLGVTDGMMIREGRWWPLCASYEAICAILFEFGKALDFTHCTFVSGAGASARAGIAALSKCGFRGFKIAGVGSAAEELAKDLRVNFFGIDIEVVPVDKIVMLAGVCSVFLNTATQEEFPTLTQELSYLNFLKRPGVIVDTTLVKTGSVFLKEAEDSGIPSIDGWRMAARADSLWAQWAFGAKIDEVAYLDSLHA
jgi:hypothetical protein